MYRGEPNGVVKDEAAAAETDKKGEAAPEQAEEEEDGKEPRVRMEKSCYPPPCAPCKGPLQPETPSSVP